MEQYLTLISVPAIATIVYWVLYLIKTAVNKESFNRFIPLIAALFGATCGVIAFFAMPQIIPAENVFVATLIGGASGLTATGTNQMFKQLTKKKEEDNNEGKINE